MVECTIIIPNKETCVGILKWYVVYRVATRGRRRRRAEAREKATMSTVFEVADDESDEGLFEFCDECGEILGDHLIDGDELVCP
jgi:hypothetical protein